jgi:hypothetical protein
MKSRILLFIISILVSSCISVEICDEDSNSVLVTKFMTLKDDNPADSLVTDFRIYGIREGMNDSLLFQSVSTSGFQVPLNPHQDFSSYVLQIGDQFDTMVVTHHQEIYMISYTCGFGNLFTLDSVENSNAMIKSYTIVKDMVDAANEQNEEHIWLYL